MSLTKKLLARMLREKLLRRNPEHAELIDHLSDERLLAMEQERHQRRLDSIERTCRQRVINAAVQSVSVSE
jgi:hypothetical protein